MGGSDSKPNPIDLEYRLLRRFHSELYSTAETTIIEHKQTKQQLALTELTLPSSPSLLTSRRLLTHPNLIQLHHHFVEQAQGMCSGISRLYALFEYHESTLDDVIREGRMLDREVKEFLRQMSNIISFLERNGRGFLIVGPKSIAVAQEEKFRTSRECLDDNALKEKTR